MSRILYPFDVGHYEAYIWAPAELLSSGTNPYRVRYATNTPFVLSAYGALYYGLVGLGLKTFGLQLWFGRLLSLGAAAVCVLCVGRIVWRITGRVEAALLAAAAAMGQFPLQLWVATQRSDLVGLGFSLGGLTLTVEGSDRRDSIDVSMASAAVLLGAGFFCRQTLLLPILAAITVTFCSGRPRRGAFLALTTGGILAFGVLVLDLTSEGGYLWQHWTLPQGIPRSLAGSFRIFVDLVHAPSTLVLIAMCAWFALARRGGGATGPELPGLAATVFVYAALAAVFALITASFKGANVNYWLEACLVSSMALGILWERFRLRGGAGRLYCWVVVVLFLASGLSLARFVRGEYFRWNSLPYYRELVATLNESVPKGEVCISEYPELVTAAGLEYHFNDYVQYGDGRSDMLVNVFREAIASRRYACLISLDPSPIPGYRLVRMQAPAPMKFRHAYLHLRDQ